MNSLIVEKLDHRVRVKEFKLKNKLIKSVIFLAKLFLRGIT